MESTNDTSTGMRDSFSPKSTFSMISLGSLHRTRKNPFNVILKSLSLTLGMSLMSIPEEKALQLSDSSQCSYQYWCESGFCLGESSCCSHEVLRWIFLCHSSWRWTVVWLGCTSITNYNEIKIIHLTSAIITIVLLKSWGPRWYITFYSFYFICVLLSSITILSITVMSYNWLSHRFGWYLEVCENKGSCTEEEHNEFTIAGTNENFSCQFSCRNFIWMPH